MNTYPLSHALRSASWLLWCDIQLFIRDWRNNALNAIFWPVVLILSGGYVLPAMGMQPDYGVFTSISMLIIMASFTAWNTANGLAADFETTRAIGYELTLPVPYWMVYSKIILSFAFKAALFNVISLVVGKLLLGNLFVVSSIQFGAFALIYLVACIFFGTFALWAASLAGTVERFMHLEIRIAGPLFFICGYSFPWQVLSTLSPTMGKLMLLTPWIYAYEGVRTTILGQAGYLDYWVCLGMLIVFTGIFGLLGLRAFKKRLDCV